MPEKYVIAVHCYRIIIYISLGYFFLKTVLPGVITIFMPFILGALVAFVTRPVVKGLRRLGVPNPVASLTALIVIFAAIGVVIFIITNYLVSEITALSSQLSPQTAEHINKFIESLLSITTSVAQKTVSLASNTILFITVFLFSSLFFTKDFDYLVRRIPKPYIKGIRRIKSCTVSIFKDYLKGALIIMCVTFALLSVGFTLLKIQYALPLALFIAVFDALPAIGAGVVMLPWAAVTAIGGDATKGVSIAVIYLVTLAARQFIEPKILSGSLGIYPIITLIGMYAGYQLLGIPGMICLPFVFAVIGITNFKKSIDNFGRWRYNKNRKGQDLNG